MTHLHIQEAWDGTVYIVIVQPIEHKGLRQVHTKTALRNLYCFLAHFLICQCRRGAERDFVLT